MPVETVQNIVLVVLALFAGWMYMTSVAFDQIADEMDQQESQKK